MTDEMANSANTRPPETAPEQSGETGKMFSQADVDRIIGDRLKRAEESVLKRFLGDIGVETPDALKELVKAQRAAAEASKTEAQRWEERLTALILERDTYKAQLEQLGAARRDDKLTVALSDALRNAGATDVEDLVVLVKAKYSGDLEGILADDETIKFESLTKLMETVRSHHARFFVSSTPGSPSNTGAKPPDKTLDRIKAVLGENPRLINF
jgi:hypothetical protein